ncbi:MAG: cysteine synthase family protein [candidate division NC10 bacterium]|nr:cysteine synthase family protein [candidate division NC10 bacterium]
MTVLPSTTPTIGQTPLVALDRLARGLPGRVLAKLETANPGGSVKDRIALAIIEAAERDGRLKPGGTVVELTSGNTGIGLAIVCAVKGYRMIAVISEGNTVERRRMLRAVGAEVVLVPQAGRPRPGQVSGADLRKVEEKTRELVERLKAFRPDQFLNPDNVAAHEQGTGREIWEQTGGRVNAFCALVGTGGTFVGVARALKARNPAVRCYAVEPAGAPVLAGRRVKNPRHKLQGGGYAFVPPLWDPACCDGFLTATDAEAIRVARRLGREEGICAGFSSGANVAAALRLARRAAPGETVVTIIADTGLRYLSTDLYPS